MILSIDGRISYSNVGDFRGQSGDNVLSVLSKWCRIFRSLPPSDRASKLERGVLTSHQLNLALARWPTGEEMEGGRGGQNFAGVFKTVFFLETGSLRYLVAAGTQLCEMWRFC